MFSRALAAFVASSTLMACGASPDEGARAIDHHVHQNGREFEALGDHARDIGRIEHEDFRDGFRNHVSRGHSQTRIGQQTGDVASVPFEDHARPGAAVNTDRQVSAEDDIQSCNRYADGREDFTNLECAEISGPRQPLQLLTWDATDGAVRREAIDKGGFR